MKENWIVVRDHRAEIMPEEDCTVWVTRSGSGKRWVQKIDFYVSNNQFDWDGVIAWMPLQRNKPKPYDKQYWANENIEDVEFIEI